MTDNPNTLKAMENQAKAKSGGGYMIRSVGKQNRVKNIKKLKFIES